MIILRNACIYTRSGLKSVSRPHTWRSSTWISSSLWPLFFSWPLVSEGAFCYKITFIRCGINVFSWTWNDRIWVGTHISCLCVCRVCLPTWFLSLTNNVENQFWLVFSTTLQYPNFYHSVLSIFDSRRRSVKISTLLLEIKWKSRPRWRQTFVKIVDPTFNVYIIVLCLENTLNDTGTTQNWIPGTDNSGLCVLMCYFIKSTQLACLVQQERTQMEVQ